MSVPRNNLGKIKAHNSFSDDSDAREGKSKSKTFKFNLRSPEKPKQDYPSLPTDHNMDLDGRNPFLEATDVFTSNGHNKTFILNLDTVASTSTVTPPRSTAAHVPAATRSLKRPSSDEPSSPTNRMKSDTSSATLNGVYVSALPSMWASSPVKQAPNPSTGLSNSSKFDQMPIEQLQRLRFSRQEKALAQADLVIRHFQSNDEEDVDSDPDLLQAQYAFLTKSVKEVDEAISRRNALGASVSSSSFSPAGISSNRDCYDTPIRPLFASSTEYVLETTEETPPPSPSPSPTKEREISNGTISNATTLSISPSSPPLSEEKRETEDDDSSMWEELAEPDCSDLRTQRSPIPSSKDQDETPALGDLGNIVYTVKESAPSPNSEYSDKARNEEAMHMLRTVFKKQEFRQNQLEAIMATLSGKDVFVLMPTGGGKSLCYQLPAICATGTTHGITVVISPLKALMEDQVQALEELEIEAVHVNSDQTDAMTGQIYNRLRGNGPKIDILYLSPEKLEGSPAINNILEFLYSQKEIARFVVDEAHVFSSWGRNFRGSYLGLRALRTDFPDVPIMALTATATDLVIKDIVNQLQLKGDYVHLAQSFNRPNLSYMVVRKIGRPRALAKTIADWIKSNHSGRTGIIYCLSRNDCDELAEELNREHQIPARAFHSDIDKDTKRETSRSWQDGKTLVIVATIAFGMGIDKPDVRFVIHHSLPKTLDGYYQETGRAGRDGKPSDCVLYYAWKDVTRLDKMIGSNLEIEEEERQRQQEEVRKMARYCMLDIDCRRQFVLQHFDELFERQKCNDGCDNCISGRRGTLHDLTKEAADIVQLVKEFESRRFTRLACIQVYRGSCTKDVKAAGFDRSQYRGRGSHWDQNTAERIVNSLILEDVLQEYNEMNKAGWSTNYIKAGSSAGDLLEGKHKFEMDIAEKKASKGKSPSKDKKPVEPVFTLEHWGFKTTVVDKGDISENPVEQHASTSAFTQDHLAFTQDHLAFTQDHLAFTQMDPEAFPRIDRSTFPPVDHTPIDLSRFSQIDRLRLSQMDHSSFSQMDRSRLSQIDRLRLSQIDPSTFTWDPLGLNTAQVDKSDVLEKPVEEHTSPEPVIGSVSATQATTVAPTDDIVDLELDGHSLISELHENLCSLRAQVAESQGKQAEDILTDECVEMMATIMPKDLAEFQEILEDLYPISFVDLIMDQYGMMFFDLCRNEAARMASHGAVDSVQNIEVTSTFSYEGAAVEDRSNAGQGTRTTEQTIQENTIHVDWCIVDSDKD